MFGRVASSGEKFPQYFARKLVRGVSFRLHPARQDGATVLLATRPTGRTDLHLNHRASTKTSPIRVESVVVSV